MLREELFKEFLKNQKNLEIRNQFFFYNTSGFKQSIMIYEKMVN